MNPRVASSSVVLQGDEGRWGGGGGVSFNFVLYAASAFEEPAVEVTAFLAGPQRHSPSELHSES